MKSKILSILLIVCSTSFSQKDTTNNRNSCWFVPNIVSYTCDVNYVDYEFIVMTRCALKTYKINVFNRWGELLFESNDIDKYWNSIEVENGTYIYQINGKYEDNTEYIFYGIVVKLD